VNIIFNPNAMEIYNKIFIWLLKIKWVNWGLKNSRFWQVNHLQRQNLAFCKSEVRIADDLNQSNDAKNDSDLYDEIGDLRRKRQRFENIAHKMRLFQREILHFTNNFEDFILNVVRR
jgi:hypothetical protein